MNDTNVKAKIELTDKQIMRTQLDAEKDLSKDLVSEVEKWKRLYEIEAEDCKRQMNLNYHMKMLIKGLI